MSGQVGHFTQFGHFADTVTELYLPLTTVEELNITDLFFPCVEKLRVKQIKTPGECRMLFRFPKLADLSFMRLSVTSSGLQTGLECLQAIQETCSNLRHLKVAMREVKKCFEGPYPPTPDSGPALTCFAVTLMLNHRFGPARAEQMIEAMKNVFFHSTTLIEANCRSCGVCLPCMRKLISDEIPGCLNVGVRFVRL